MVFNQIFSYTKYLPCEHQLFFRSNSNILVMDSQLVLNSTHGFKQRKWIKRKGKPQQRQKRNTQKYSKNIHIIFIHYIYMNRTILKWRNWKVSYLTHFRILLEKDHCTQMYNREQWRISHTTHHNFNIVFKENWKKI